MILENVTEMWTEVRATRHRAQQSRRRQQSAAASQLCSACPCSKDRGTLKDAWGVLRAALQIPKTGKGHKASRPVNKDRFINKMFLRGDSVVLVL